MAFLGQNKISTKNHKAGQRPTTGHCFLLDYSLDVCDKGSIWNQSSSECECDKSCGIGEYLDYENCKCRKRLADKLVEECIETVEEVKLAKIILTEDKNKHKCSSCTLYIRLFSIIFTINIGIVTYFVYYKYMNRDKETASRYDYVYQTKNY